MSKRNPVSDRMLDKIIWEAQDWIGSGPSATRAWAKSQLQLAQEIQRVREAVRAHRQETYGTSPIDDGDYECDRTLYRTVLPEGGLMDLREAVVAAEMAKARTYADRTQGDDALIALLDALERAEARLRIVAAPIYGASNVPELVELEAAGIGQAADEQKVR